MHAKIYDRTVKPVVFRLWILEPERNLKVIYIDKSLEFGKACEDLSWNHGTSTPHRSETNGIAERAVRRVKEGTSAVLLQTSLNENWWADSVECYTYLRNVTDLSSDGITPYESRFGQPFKSTDYSIWFIGWVSLYNCEGPIKNPSIWKESLTWIVPRIRSVREFGKVTYWSQTLRSWRRWTHRKSTRKDSMRKRDISSRKRKIYLSSRRWTNRICWRRSAIENIHLDTGAPIRGESHVDFLGESEGSLPPPHDSLPDAGEAINDFWSC